jgi:hypothetical protein
MLANICCETAEMLLLGLYFARRAIYFGSDTTFRTRGPFVSRSLCTAVCYLQRLSAFRRHSDHLTHKRGPNWFSNVWYVM